MSDALLNQAMREKLFAGECPAIYGPRKVKRKRSTKDAMGNPTVKEVEVTILRQCPVDAGDTVELSSKLTLRVIRVDARATGWKLHYEVQDKRDAPQLIRRTPPVVVPRNDDHPSADAIKKASRESAYTSSPIAAINDAGEGVGEKAQQRFTKEAEDGFAAHLERERREQKARRLDERLRNLEIVAAQKGVDVSGHLAAVERRIESAERKVGRDAA